MVWPMYFSIQGSKINNCLNTFYPAWFCNSLASLGLFVKQLGFGFGCGKVGPTVGRVFSHLVGTSEPFERVVLVLDGLNRCSRIRQRNDLLPLFRALAGVDINVFVTSQLHPGDIQPSLQIVTKIDLTAKHEDIKICIVQEIDSYPRAGRLLEKGGCLDRFVAELIACAGGM